MNPPRPDLDELMARTAAFHDGAAGALLYIDAIGSLDLPDVAPLDSWGFPSVPGRDAYLAASLTRQDALFAARRAAKLWDDTLPTMAPFYGMAEFDAFLPGAVTVTGDTTWKHPNAPSLAPDDWPGWDGASLWYAMTIGGMEVLHEMAGDRYALRQRGFLSPLDLARSMRGSALFTDMYDEPEALHRLLDYCVVTNRRWFALQQEMTDAGSWYGGSLLGFGVWLPGLAAGHFSEDAAALCSPVAYAAFGREYARAMTEDLDGVFIHTHPACAHCLDQIAALPNLRALDLYNDPNMPRGIEIYRRYAGVIPRRVAVEIYPTREEIRENLRFLKERKTMIRYAAADMDDARDMLAYVRRELPVLL